MDGKILAFRETLPIIENLNFYRIYLIREKKILWKTSLIKDKFFCLENFPKFFLRKNSLVKNKSFFVENFHKCFFMENFPDQGKIFFVENFPDQRKIFFLWKTSLKFFLWKNSLIKEKSFLWKAFLNLFLWKNSLIKEKLLYCGKLTFLSAEKIIGLTVLKANTNV